MRVAVCSRSFSKNETLRSKLEERHVDVKFNDQGLVFDNHTLVSFLLGYDAAIVGLEKINSDVLSRLPELKVIGKYGVGLDKIDLKACHAHGVRIGWKPGVNAVAVAELTLSMAITIVRGIARSNYLVRDGSWQQVTGKQLSSLTVGVIGCGHVGSKVVELLSGFKCRVFVFDKEDRADVCRVYNAEQVTFSFLIKNSDVISIHLPDDTGTRSLFDKNFYNEVKFGSYLINTARGSLLSDRFILDGLNSGVFAGVALDVLEVEPPESSGLVQHQNCFVTSHIGGSSEEAILAMGMAAIEGLKNNLAACDLSEI